LELLSVVRVLSQWRQCLALSHHRLTIPVRSSAKAREGADVRDLRDLLPANDQLPFLVVTFLSDRSLQATPFDSEEEASAFIDRVTPSPQLPI